MLLNLHLLYPSLERLGFEGDISRSPFERHLVRPMLCDDWPESPSDDILYIVDSASIPANTAFTGRASVLCLGAPPEGMSNSKYDVLFIQDDSVKAVDVMNLMAEEFASFAQWEMSMQHAFEQDSPQTMTELTAQLAGNPVEVWESAVHLMCYCVPKTDGDVAALEEFEREHPWKAGYVMPEDEYETLMTDTEYLATASVREPSIYSDKTLGFRTIYYNIFLHEKPFARICISEIARPFAQRDFTLIHILGEFVDKLLSAKGPHLFLNQNRFLDVMTGLLDHRLQSEARIRSFLAELNWSDSDEYVCFVIRERITTQSAEYDLAGFSFRLSKFLPRSCCVLHDGSLVFLLNLTQAEKTREDVCRQILPLMRDNLLVAGISTQFHPFRDLHYFYKQARCAYDIGRRCEPERWYYRFEDYQLDYLLSRYRSGLNWRALIPPKLYALIEHDAQNNTAYVPTLHVYLETGCKAGPTAEKLFVHRNTLTYRIERLEELLGMSLDSEQNRIILKLALMILTEEGRLDLKLA